MSTLTWLSLLQTVVTLSFIIILCKFMLVFSYLLCYNYYYYYYYIMSITLSYSSSLSEVLSSLLHTYCVASITYIIIACFLRYRAISALYTVPSLCITTKCVDGGICSITNNIHWSISSEDAQTRCSHTGHGPLGSRNARYLSSSAIHESRSQHWTWLHCLLRTG